MLPKYQVWATAQQAASRAEKLVCARSIDYCLGSSARPSREMIESAASLRSIAQAALADFLDGAREACLQIQIGRNQATRAG